MHVVCVCVRKKFGITDMLARRTHTQGGFWAFHPGMRAPTSAPRERAPAQQHSRAAAAAADSCRQAANRAFGTTPAHMLRPAPAKLSVPESNRTTQHATRPTVLAAKKAEQRAAADAAKAAAQQEAKRAAADKSKRRATEKAMRVAAESALESAAAATEALYEALRLQPERPNAGETDRVDRWEALLAGESAMPRLSVDSGMYKEPQQFKEPQPEPPGARTQPAAADGFGPSASSPWLDAARTSPRLQRKR